LAISEYQESVINIARSIVRIIFDKILVGVAKIFYLGRSLEVIKKGVTWDFICYSSYNDDAYITANSSSMKSKTQPNNSNDNINIINIK